MAEFAKKGVMGYKVLPGGRNDSESTHAILSLEEYDELCGEVRRYLPKEEVKALREKFELTYGHRKSPDGG